MPYFHSSLVPEATSQFNLPLCYFYNTCQGFLKGEPPTRHRELGLNFPYFGRQIFQAPVWKGRFELNVKCNSITPGKESRLVFSEVGGPPCLSEGKCGKKGNGHGLSINLGTLQMQLHFFPMHAVLLG